MWKHIKTYEQHMEKSNNMKYINKLKHTWKHQNKTDENNMWKSNKTYETYENNDMNHMWKNNKTYEQQMKQRRSNIIENRNIYETPQTI